MFFNKKKEASKGCESCGAKNSKGNNYCANCGNSFLSPEEELKQFGFLGRNDSLGLGNAPVNLGVIDKVFSSIIQGFAKSLESQLNNGREMNRTEVKSFPNGIRIKMGPFPLNSKQKNTAPRNSFKKVVSEKQIQRMSSLPRTIAKSRVRRLGDKVVYELATPGVSSAEDVFVTRVESGYEVKAIGEKRIYVNSLPFNLPIKKVELAQDKVLVEFHPELQEEF